MASNNIALAGQLERLSYTFNKLRFYVNIER